jgi:hypothetical protein
MLYLHCGWPRTGTSSFQDALYRRRADLCAAGTVFPLRWMSDIGPTHHGLSDLLAASRADSAPLDEFKAFLVEHHGTDILFSAEVLTSWLIPKERRETLLAFFSDVSDMMSVRCVWTLRRLDELTRSMCLLAMSDRPEFPPPADRYHAAAYLNPVFAGMSQVADVIGDVVYLKYDSAGAHQVELVDALGIRDSMAAVIRRELERHPRLNCSLTHKQAALFTNLEALSRRAGVDFDREALRHVVHDGELQFEDDQRCELVDGELSRSLHEYALEASRRAGVAPYAEFFGASEVLPASASELSPQVLTDRDLEHLRFVLERARISSIGANSWPGRIL